MNKYEAWCTVAFFGLLLLLIATKPKDTGSNQLSYGPDATTMKSDVFPVESAQS